MLCVVGSFASAKIGGNAMTWHLGFGYAVCALLAFRLVWGFTGGHWSRFANFLYSPATLLRYLRGEGLDDEQLDVGHTPLGSASVLAMLLFPSAQVASGLFADDEVATTGPLNKLVSRATGLWFSGYHQSIGQWVLLALILLHVAAILTYRLRLRIDLIGPMISRLRQCSITMPDLSLVAATKSRRSDGCRPGNRYGPCPPPRGWPRSDIRLFIGGPGAQARPRVGCYQPAVRSALSPSTPSITRIQ